MLGQLDVDLPGLLRAPRSARPLLRFCTDWTEQRHHLAGALGAGLAGRLFELGWVGHAPSASRAVRLSGEGRAGLAATFGVRLDDDATLVLLDQRRLPAEIVVQRYTRWPDVIEAIRSMVVAAESRSATRAVQDASAAISRWYKVTGWQCS